MTMQLDPVGYPPSNYAVEHSVRTPVGQRGVNSPQSFSFLGMPVSENITIVSPSTSERGAMYCTLLTLPSYCILSYNT